MGFQFSLQGLLRVRESFERKEEQKLAAAIGELKRLKMMLASVREQLTATDDRLSAILAGGTTGAHLHLLYFERMPLEYREQALTEHVSTALKLVQEQRTCLQEARQKRKVVEDLRQKELTLYLLAEGRKDQQRLDDTFLRKRFQEDTGKSVA
jgi:flagellar export protein FliJ